MWNIPSKKTTWKLHLNVFSFISLLFLNESIKKKESCFSRFAQLCILREKKKKEVRKTDRKKEKEKRKNERKKKRREGGREKILKINLISSSTSISLDAVAFKRLPVQTISSWGLDLHGGSLVLQGIQFNSSTSNRDLPHP